MYRIQNKNMFHCIIYLACFLQVTKKPSLMLDTSKPEAIKLRSFGVLLPRCGEWFGKIIWGRFWMGQGQSAPLFDWDGCVFSNLFWNIQCDGGPGFEVLLNCFGLMGNRWDISQYYHSHVVICDPRWQSWGIEFYIQISCVFRRFCWLPFRKRQRGKNSLMVWDLWHSCLRSCLSHEVLFQKVHNVMCSTPIFVWWFTKLMGQFCHGCHKKQFRHLLTGWEDCDDRWWSMIVDIIMMILIPIWFARIRKHCLMVISSILGAALKPNLVTARRKWPWLWRIRWRPGCQQTVSLCMRTEIQSI